MTDFAIRSLRSNSLFWLFALVLSFVCILDASTSCGQDSTLRVFVFAGQSNMVGSDSKAEDIENFPPFRGLDAPQSSVKFWFCLGREDKTRSDGWTTLRPINGIVGPELSFAREISRHVTDPVAIIKVAAGGTHLGGDWNPNEPSGFEMYPLLIKEITAACAELKRQDIDFRFEGFMWHQGENDMFNAEYMANYGKNLEGFVKSVRRDLETPDLNFYVGELCTKTIWGMDLRPRMYAISLGQKEVANSDDHVTYVPTSHVGVEIGGGVGLHYHYGTLGQLEHGVNYARAYLDRIGKLPRDDRSLQKWPYPQSEKVKLFILAGHRNMEGERAFVQFAEAMGEGKQLLQARPNVAFKYSLGGGYKVSPDWEPLGTVDYYDTFGPELSFASKLESADAKFPIAIAKFTHSGSQMIDWTPEGSEAKSRNLYRDFIEFVESSIAEIEEHGNSVELAGIFYHIGENDMSWGPFRKAAPEHLQSLVRQCRIDLQRAELEWFVSQQPPTDDDSVNSIDVVTMMEKVANEDAHLHLIQVFDLPAQEKKLVLNTAGVIELGNRLAEAYLQSASQGRSGD